MPYCPKCGKEVEEGAAYCPSCGASLREGTPGEVPIGFPSDVGVVEHLSIAFNLAMAKPMIFVPAILGSVISSLIGLASSAFVGASRWPWWSGGAFMGPAGPGLMGAGVLFGIVGAAVSYVLGFASIDMSREAYVNEPLDLMGSVNYVLGRLGTFIIASIVGAIMAITIILIPVVLFMFVIIVVDDTGIGSAISRAFSAIGRDLGDVILVIIVAIVGSAILGFVPLIGGLLTTALNVIIGLAFIDIYLRYKKSF
jgi:hypothetical protein